MGTNTNTAIYFPLRRMFVTFCLIVQNVPITVTERNVRIMATDAKAFFLRLIQQLPMRHAVNGTFISANLIT